MKSSWIAGAAGSPPATPGSFSNGYPTDGNPGTATPPTEPGAWWFYMTTQEIVNAITAAGLTPSATTLTQLTAAINALAAAAAPVQSVNGRTGAVTGVVDTSSFTGANQSLGSAAGYQKLPGGVILQWGQSAASVGGTSVTFPIAFPTACRNVSMGQQDGSAEHYIGNITTTGFKYYAGLATANTDNQWLAVGY